MLSTYVLFLAITAQDYQVVEVLTSKAACDAVVAAVVQSEAKQTDPDELIIGDKLRCIHVVYKQADKEPEHEQTKVEAQPTVACKPRVILSKTVTCLEA